MTERYEVVNRHELDRAAWDAFVDAAEEAWLWHRCSSQDALLTWPGAEDRSFAVCDRIDGGKIVAVVPLRKVNRRLLSVLAYYHLESTGGPVLRNATTPRTRREVLGRIRDHLRCIADKGLCVAIRLTHAPMAPAFRGERCPRVNPLVEMGCANTMSQTLVVDLRPGKGTLWARMEGRARTAVRKAEKCSVTIRPGDREGDTAVYYALHCETYRRTSVPPHPRAYFETIWRELLGAGLAQVWVAEHDGYAVAAQNFGLYKGAAIYWTGASTRTGLAVEANSALQWHAMQWMVDAGIEWYETGESFPAAFAGKRKGLSDFKHSFGGEPYPFYRGNLELTSLIRAYRAYDYLRKGVW